MSVIANKGKVIIPAANPIYKVYTALLNQSGTNAPVATILENGIGAIEWVYDSPGIYRGILLGAFPENKTYPVIHFNGQYDAEIRVPNITFHRIDDDQLWLSFHMVETSFVNSGLVDTPLEIRVYP
jgi:hypothetical protein